MQNQSATLKTEEYTAPSSWSSYLINGDASGIDDSEQAEADAFVAHVGPGNHQPHLNPRRKPKIRIKNMNTNNALDYAASVRHAILRSISHDEIVRTPVPADRREEMIDYLEEQEEIERLNSSDENDGSLNVWGKFKGDNFHIQLI